MNPRHLAVVLCSGLMVVGVLLAVTGALREQSPPASAPREVSASLTATTEAIDLLREWDLRRARAWADGDVRALGRLYAPGSRAGRHDRAALAAYADRGLRVTGLRMQLLAVEVRRWGERRLVLVVTDRLAHAVARGGRRAVGLPRDEPSTWRLTLRRAAGEWLVVEVRRAPSPAPP